MDRPRVLCVDDEPNVLQGLRRTLRRRFDVHLASSGDEAIDRLNHDEPFAVLCSDFRMPGMDGAELLAKAQQLAPDTIRILLSGQADLGAMVRVVNDGGIYRFLMKPASPDALISVLDDSVRLYQLRNAEKELLEGTVLGSVTVLSQALSLVAPKAFGHYERVRSLVNRMAKKHETGLDWVSEAAVRLAGIGFLSIPPEVVDTWVQGSASILELHAVQAVPEIGASLVRHIPRFDTVAELIEGCRDPKASSPWVVWAIAGGSVYVRARAQGQTRDQAVATVKRQIRGKGMPPGLLEELKGSDIERQDEHQKEIRADELTIGMVLARDLFTKTNVLLMSESSEVTKAALDRIRNFGDRFGIQEPVFVQLPESG